MGQLEVLNFLQEQRISDPRKWWYKNEIEKELHKRNIPCNKLFDDLATMAFFGLIESKRKGFLKINKLFRAYKPKFVRKCRV